MIYFDHIEIHVSNSKLYVEFLKELFGNGRFKRISENNTYMFLTPDGLRFEIKENVLYKNNFNLVDGIGFCLPCFRMAGAKAHLEQFNSIVITKELDNPDGKVYFFKDYEGIDWHVKDYEILDVYTNI